MVEVSIVCLIYKSTDLADAVYNSVLTHTPMIESGVAEFFFIANDPTAEVVQYLEHNNIPHYINMNKHLDETELFNLGFGTPEYIRRVYQGYNLGILKAKGQRVVLINSDNFFSPDWLENLLKYSDYNRIVCSTIVEPGHEKFGVFPFATEKYFGRTLDDYNDSEFQKFVSVNSKTGYTSGGAYMPCLVYRDVAIIAGLYPEGNIAGKKFDEIKRYGDEKFYDKLKELGVEHITSKDSIVYHLKEGEKSEVIIDETPYKSSFTDPIKLNDRLKVYPRDFIGDIGWKSRHREIMDNLGKKFTILIIDPQSEAEVDQHIETVANFSFKNIETVLITDNKDYVSKYKNRVGAIIVASSSLGQALYELFHKMYGEYLLVLNPNCHYNTELFNEINNRNFIYYFGDEQPKDNHIYDYMGYYLVSKSTIVDNISIFLELFLNKEKVSFNFRKYRLKDTLSINTQKQELQQRVGLAKKVVHRYKESGLKGVALSFKKKVSDK